MTSELAKPTPKPKQALKELLEGDYFRAEISKALPNGSPQAFVRAALTAAMRNPDLYKCEPNSVWKCLFDLAQMGLSPDGRRAHLIPFKGECTLIVDYKGIAELARKNGDVSHIHCDVVHKGEHYVCRYGTDGRLEHEPNSEFENEPIVCAYSYVKFLIPGTEIQVEEYTQMSIKEILEIRERSQSYKIKKGPWITDFNEMAKKTVFRRHSKTLSLSPETRKAIEYGDEKEYGEMERFHRAIPAVVPKPVDPLLDNGDAVVDPGKTGSESSEPAKKPAKAEKPAKKPATRAVESTEPNPFDDPAQQKEQPANDPRQTNFLEPTSPDDGRPSTDQLVKNLDHLISVNQIDKTRFFQWLRYLGVKHKAVERFPNSVVMTSFDLSNANLVECVDNWEANSEDFKKWESETFDEQK